MARPAFPARIAASPLGLRLATAAVGIPPIIGAILVGGPLFAALLGLALAIAFWEVAGAAGASRRSPAFPLGLATIGAALGAALTDAAPIHHVLAWGLLAIFGLAACAAAVRIREPDIAALRRVLRAASVSALAATAFAAAGAAFVLLRAGEQGAEWMLLAVLAVMSTDAAAYAVGRTLGKRRLAPAISPNKTVEGAIGGWLGGFAAAIALDQILGLRVEIWPFAILALILPLFAQAGDLAESLFKRAQDVKDSSGLIPGHGGVLDRLDSLLFGIPAVYFFVEWTT